MSIFANMWQPLGRVLTNLVKATINPSVPATTAAAVAVVAADRMDVVSTWQKMSFRIFPPVAPFRLDLMESDQPADEEAWRKLSTAEQLVSVRDKLQNCIIKFDTIRPKLQHEQLRYRDNAIRFWLGSATMAACILSLSAPVFNIVALFVGIYVSLHLGLYWHEKNEARAACDRLFPEECIWSERIARHREKISQLERLVKSERLMPSSFLAPSTATRQEQQSVSSSANEFSANSQQVIAPPLGAPSESTRWAWVTPISGFSLQNFPIICP